MNVSATLRPILAALLLAAAPLAATQAAPAPSFADNAAAHPSFTVKVVGKGQPMLLIPGLTCPGVVWDATVAHYQKQYQCHIVSLAGFGASRLPLIPPTFCRACATSCWATSKPTSSTSPSLWATAWAASWVCG
ncbi:alpha/beta fold hydrolase [Hymenobacter cellulosilyticus]|uniref:Alpha/beta hydrolase n=1 Tax=Hymenobacter cellulosilyticus TaxID=2932248 RepID=A0A8T9QJ66_9BACT|nr:hypothetical protein [Hymenobacter cellulosilyticus]UOQ74823.1 hypothetical protein MUN79_13695 [Hymenobacter cellulosilyticus]